MAKEDNTSYLRECLHAEFTIYCDGNGSSGKGCKERLISTDADDLVLCANNRGWKADSDNFVLCPACQKASEGSE